MGGIDGQVAKASYGRRSAMKRSATMAKVEQWGKSGRSVLLGVTFIILATLSASAQVGRIEGDVVKANSGEPITGAEIQIVRQDIRGTYNVKSDKKGHFLHAGVPYVGTYTLIVSAEGHTPYFLTGIRPTGDVMKVELQPGDGRKLTIDDVKRIQSSDAASGMQRQLTAEEIKKQQEDYEKKRQEIEKQKVDFDNMKKTFEQGQQLAANKDYAGAITAYRTASQLDPEQEAVWANLALAHYNRGVTNLNESLRDATLREPAKQDFADASGAADKAIALAEAKFSDASKAAAAKKSKIQYLKIKADSESLLARRLGVAEMADSAVKSYRDAANGSDLPAEKVNFELKAAETYYESGKIEESVAMYKAILEGDPNNIEGLYKLGLAYAALADFQASANTLQLFVDRAPAEDPRVAEVKMVIKDLIVGNNLEAPKSLPAQRGRPAPRKKP
jgi:cytochrome c-type biogenesis protein CcmH/NrfG